MGSLLLLFLSVNIDLSNVRDERRIRSSYTISKVMDLLAIPFNHCVVTPMGGFAFVTMLMKNHLMDNLSADYVRTAMAKGVSFKNAVLKHALRNSLVPLATNSRASGTLFVTDLF